MIHGQTSIDCPLDKSGVRIKTLQQFGFSRAALYDILIVMCSNEDQQGRVAAFCILFVHYYMALKTNLAS